MNNHSCLTAILRMVPVTSLLAVLPFASCSNSDSIGRLTDGGNAGSGGSLGGSGGAGGSGAGGSVASGGGAGVSGVGGMQTATGGSGAGGKASSTGGSAAGGAAGSGGQGSRDAALDGAQCVLTNLYCPYGYVTDAQGCPVSCVPGPGTGGTSGTGDSKSDDVRGPDVQVSPDAQDLAALCTSTGGLVDSGLCCASVGDFPDSCQTGACGCSPGNSHTVATCSCPQGECFSTKIGCASSGTVADAGPDSNVACGSATCGAGEYCCNPATSLCAPVGYGCIQEGGDAGPGVDSNGCTAQPGGDATNCGGSRPAHYYICTLTMLAAPCATLSIGDVTNTFCCP